MNSESYSSRLKRKYDTFSDSIPAKSCKGKYDVFLSFRGEDTRKGFVSHLYDRLKRRGIITYKDDKGLERGESIGPELFKAIEESRSAIVVLSRNYASSTWCLKELLHVLKCCQEKDNDYKVFPVFYDVEPTEVRKQIGDFGKGFDKIKEKESKIKIEEWRKALVQISNISGWDWKKYESEVELIDNLVEKVSTAVRSIIDLSIVSKQFVGMDVRLNKVNQLLDLSSEKVLAVGIWGMGGIGKTTIAQLIFEQVKRKFEGSCFVENVKKKLKTEGLSRIQELILNDCLLGSSESIQTPIDGRIKLMGRLSRRKVLIALDDVDKSQELEYLIGEEDSRHLSFGEGSRIIITTRHKDVLETNGVYEIYEVDQLSLSESLKLFHQKAFKKDAPSKKEYSDASEGIVKKASGHPLALRVLGSSLQGRNVNEWMETLARLKKFPNPEISGSLEVSFYGLDDPDKEIFLDIACFFVGESYGYVKDALRSLRSDVGVGISIRNLVNKCLITIIEYRDRFQMLDLLSDLFHYFSTQKFQSSIGKPNEYNNIYRIRILDLLSHLFWNFTIQELSDLFPHFAIREFPSSPSKHNEYIHRIQMHDLLSDLDQHIVTREFSSSPGKHNEYRDRIQMHDLLSDLGQHIVTREFLSSPGKRTRICSINDMIQVLTNNKGTEDVEVIGHLNCMSSSSLIRWNVYSLLKMPNLKCLISRYASIESSQRPSTVLEKLTFVDLRCSTFICGSMNFSIFPNLQRLYLSECRNLRKLDQSVGCLKQLVHLDLSRSDIESLPSSFSSLTSLQTLVLDGCINLEQLPSSIVHLSSLEELDLSRCTGLQLPNSLSGLCSLKMLCLDSCELGDGAIPDDIGSLSSLKKLDLSGNVFVSIPESISQLSQLTHLLVIDCKNLMWLPKHLPLSLQTLDVTGCHFLATHLPIWMFGKPTIGSLREYRMSRDEYLSKKKSPIQGDLWYFCLIKQNISEGHLFKIIWPLLDISRWNLCLRSFSVGCCVRTKLSTSVSAPNMHGYALYVFYEVLELDHGCSTLESTHVRKKFLCNFCTNQGRLKHQLEFDMLICKRAGSYGLFMYIPKDWFGDQLNAASYLHASVASMNICWQMKVIACDAKVVGFDNCCIQKFYRVMAKSESFFMTAIRPRKMYSSIKNIKDST